MSIGTEQDACGQTLETPDGRRLALRREGDADVPLASVFVHGLELTHEQLTLGIGTQLINQGLWLTEHADQLNVELLVLLGEQDELCDHDTTNEFIAKAGKQCQQEVFPGLRHSLLIERDRQQVYDAIDGWLESTSDRPAE